MVQIDPQAAAAATAPPPPPAAAPAHAPGTIVVNTPSGAELALEPGRQVVARVVEVSPDNTARISLAGQTLVVQTDTRLRVGDSIQLSVERADATQVRLAIVPASNLGAEAGGAGLGGRGANGSSAAALIGELARAGVPVTPELAKAIATIADQLGTAAAPGGSATGIATGIALGAAAGRGGADAAGANVLGGAPAGHGTDAGTAAIGRALATLAGRDIALSPAAAGRVAAAIELAGSLGPALASLASRSATVAAALPAGPPSADALRSLLTPGLEPAELAIARIVQAGSGSAGAGTTSTSTPAQASAIRSYVAAQVATDVQLDTLPTHAAAAASTTTAAPPATSTTEAPRVPGSGLAGAAMQAALRGTAAAGANPSGAAFDLSEPLGADAGRTARLVPTSPGAPTAGQPNTTSDGAPASAARATASASAATGAATAMPALTAPRIAQAVADLGTIAARVATEVAPATGAVGAAGFDASRGSNATQVAQAAGRDGAVAASQASEAGAAASGDPAPVITAVREFLASPRSEADTAKLLRMISTVPTPVLERAIQTLPEHQSLQLAGALLDGLPGAETLNGSRLASLRLGVHAALQDLGRALHPPLEHDVATLRHALEQVAATDPRPAVAQDAARMLSAIDGQQLLSRTATGADPGYVYFQVPMPDGRGAEVMVRRDAARRDVTFDEFNIAFLLNTERLGTLMISLDAQPSGIRADIKTDAAGLGDLLQVHADALAEPLSNAARRPVTITTGTFDDVAPRSLLDQPLAATPGATSLYA